MQSISETLQNKIAVLAEQYKKAEKQVEELTEAFNKSAKENGYASDETQELAQKLKDAESKAESFKGEIDSLTSSTKFFGNTTENQSARFKKAWSAVSVAIGNLISGAVAKVVSAIKSNIDSAIARVDTLNNYTTVMTGLGYSAEEANAAIGALTDGIQGLPTTLPNIVSQQQQFAALSGNIEEATNLTLSLNNATLAGGQGQSVANEALSQWYQIIANGTPDLESWRIINQAMPAQLQQIAQELLGTTATSQDLFTAWQSGTITTEEVTAAVMKLNNEGGEGFDSFAEQAQAASGGIATSMENVKTAIINKLAEVISEMDGDSGRITGIFDTIKQAIKDINVDELAESLGGLVETIATTLQNIDLSSGFSSIASGASILVSVIGFLINNFGTLLPIIISVATAAKTFSVALSISETVNSLTTAINGGTTAFQALSIAMGGGPFVLIITLIATLVAAFITLWNTNEGFREAVISAWDAIKEVFSTVVDAIVTFFTATIPDALNSVATFFSDIWNTITNAVSSAWDAISSKVSSAISAVASVIQSVMSAIQGVISTIWNAISSKVSSAVNVIKSVVSSAFNAIKSVASSVWNSIKSAITTPIEAAKNAVKAAIDKIKSFFNFTWKLPDLKLPHISITGSFSLSPPSVPHFSVEWYKKAYDNAMLLNNPTIFGYYNGKFLGGGDGVGAEVVAGASTLKEMIRGAVSDVVSSSGNVSYTQIFNSPKSLSRREIRRETRNIVREMQRR